MKAAVTGGSGVVGSAVIRHLVGAGHEVVALSRTLDTSEKLASLGASPVRGDVLNRDSLTGLVDGVDWVFHVAGVNELCSRRPDRMWKVNVEGTRNVLDATRDAGALRLIHTSSAVTIGQEGGAVGAESTEHRGWYLSEYERSKTAAERLVLGESEGQDVVSVNPSSVQGPGRATGTGRILLSAARGRMPFAIETSLSLVDIDDCARGHLLAAERGTVGERYILSGATIAVAEAVALLSSVAPVDVNPRYLAPGVLSPIAGAIDRVARILRLSTPICRETVRVLAHGHDYDGSKATRDLDLQYTPVSETLRKTVDWFRREGLVPNGK